MAVLAETTMGFIAIKADSNTFVGEIGLNAIAPLWTGRDFGLAMYEFAVNRLREAGMKVAVVSTGGDVSHQAARQSYLKAGFDVEIPSTWMCRKL